MILKKVSFGTTKIQALRRVTLDQNLLETLGLSVGDTVRVELDTENGTVLISRVLDQALQCEAVTTSSGRSRAKRK
jgi:bifunctional DNA-binding transcriptional regulator/antitoxin component of YhaV-PrlF toxin-antitoxin module